MFAVRLKKQPISGYSVYAIGHLSSIIFPFIILALTLIRPDQGIGTQK